MWIKIMIVCCFITLDFLTGLAKALKNGDFTSSMMRMGLFAKCGELGSLGFMAFLEWGLPHMGIVATIPFVTGVSVYISIMETGSIIENLGAIAPRMGAPLSKIFRQLKTATNMEEETNAENS